MWDPRQYELFSDDRQRPFQDLLARVWPDRAPRLVVDLGCGDGSATLTLAQRWPDARIVGVDASPQMLDRARELDTRGRVEWHEEPAQTWDPTTLGDGIDALITNAALQWIPTHRELLPQWVAALNPGGWLGLQVPHNVDAPSHALMRAVADRSARARQLRTALARAAAAGTAHDYLELLTAAGMTTDAWTTTYVHVLPRPTADAEHPVLAWVRSTGLRPVFEILDETERADFLAAYEQELRAAYPIRDYGVVFEFERVFAVGQKP